jgi:hypothetical protein
VSVACCTPLVLFEGKILDGRNRYRACVESGAAVRTTTYDGNDPRGFVRAENLLRRHLDESQRAMAAAREFLLVAESTENLPVITEVQASVLWRVSERSVRYAVRLISGGTAEVPQRARPAV